GEWTGESVHGGGHSATHGGFPALGGGEFARSAHDLGGFGVQGASVSARCRIPRGTALQHRGARGWGGIRSRWYSAHGTCFVGRIAMVHPLCPGARGRADVTSGRTCPTGVLLGARGENVMCRYVPRTARQDPGKGSVHEPEKTSSPPFHRVVPPGRSLRPTALRSPRRE